jgi:hypothetical protein
MGALRLFRHPDGYAESEMGTNRIVGHPSQAGLTWDNGG